MPGVGCPTLWPTRPPGCSGSRGTREPGNLEGLLWLSTLSTRMNAREKLTSEGSR